MSYMTVVSGFELPLLMKPINIKALAQELHLSVSTVSKALRDSYEISDETKKRVLQLAEELNYIPNPYASSLRRKKSKNIAVVIPEVADSFFSLAINGIESIAQQKNYHVLVYLTHESAAKEQAILKEFGSGRVDGVLISVSRDTASGSHISDLISMGVPVVFFDRACEEVETAKVTTNDFESGYKATTLLLEHGCTHIAYLAISKSLSIINKRMEGYRKALDDHRIETKAKDIVLCTTDAGENYTAIKKLLSQKNRPDGIVASVEKLTTPVYQVCKDLGLRIPDDVRVICFSNLETAPILDPPLTTVTQPAFEIGKAAAALLVKALEKSSFNLKKEEVIIPATIVERDSTNNTVVLRDKRVKGKKEGS